MSVVMGGFHPRLGDPGDDRGALGAVESSPPQKSPISNTTPEALNPTANSIAPYPAATVSGESGFHAQSPGDVPVNDRTADSVTSPSLPRTSIMRSESGGAPAPTAHVFGASGTDVPAKIRPETSA